MVCLNQPFEFSLFFVLFTLFVFRDTQVIQTMLHQVLPNIFGQLPQCHGSSFRHLPPDIKNMLFFRHHEIVDPVFGDFFNLVSDELPHIDLFFVLNTKITFGFLLDLRNFDT